MLPQVPNPPTDQLAVTIALLQQNAQHTNEMLRMLHDQHATNTKMLIAVEESQRTSTATLQEVRGLLSKLVDDHNSLKSDFAAHRDVVNTSGKVFVEQVHEDLEQLREDLSKQGESLDTINTTLARHEERLDAHSSQLKVAAGVVTTALTAIVSKLTGLI